MFKFNIYIAKRGRDEQLATCLHYLNLANENKAYIVYVVITEDSLDEAFARVALPPDQDILNPSRFPNLSFVWSCSSGGPKFNKSKCLNNCITIGTQIKPDAVMIVDLDMIYRPTIFNDMRQQIDKGYNYIVSHGWHLESHTRGALKLLPPIEEVERLDKQPFTVGPSQITLTVGCLNFLLSLFGPQLYDETFDGWGYEDSLISTMSRHLQRFKRIRKTELQDKWFHQWHLPAVRNEEHLLYFEKRNAEIIQKLETLYA